MSILQSVLLGFVQGLTEFLPVSSSGHLSILQNFFHIDTGESILFDVSLHLATLLVVFYVFRRDIGRLVKETIGMIRDLLANGSIRRQNKGAITGMPLRCVVKNNYRKFALLLIVSTIPTALIGYLGKKLVSDASRSLLITGIGLLVTAVILLLSDRIETQGKIPRDITYREGLIIGIAQGFAVLPGLSRSGATIFSCLHCGIDRLLAVRYSFILSIPAILGAAVLSLKDADLSSITPMLCLTYAAGMAAAACTGFLCIKGMLVLIRKRKFRYLAIYCFFIGVLSIIGHFVG